MVRRKLSRKEILIAVAGIAVAFAVLTLYLWQSAENVRLGYAVGRAEDGIKALKNEIRILETRKAARLAPAVVDRTAREKLGLGDPRPDQVVVEDD